MHNHISHPSHQSSTYQTGGAAAAAGAARADEHAGAAAAGGPPITARATRKALPSEDANLIQLEEDFEACTQAIEAKDTALLKQHLEALISIASQNTRTLEDELAALPEFYRTCTAEDTIFEPGYRSKNYPHGLTRETIFNKCFHPNNTDQTTIDLRDPEIIYHIFDRYGYIPSQVPTEYEYISHGNRFTINYHGAVDTNFVQVCKYIDEQTQAAEPVAAIGAGLDDFNVFKILPPLIGQLSGLKELIIIGHRILRIPHEISHLTNLTSLIAITQTLRSIPNALQKLNQLTRLYLRDNQLRIFPTFIDALQQLNHLMIDTNNIRSVPASLALCKALESLCLSRNPLQALDSTLLQLPALTQLELSYCEIRALPDKIIGNNTLVMIALAGNPLTHLPEGMIEMQSLGALKTARCRLDPQSQAMANFFRQHYFRAKQIVALRKNNAHVFIHRDDIAQGRFHEASAAIDSLYDQCCPAGVTFPTGYSKQHILDACFGTDGFNPLRPNDMRIVHFAARFGYLPSEISPDHTPFMTQEFVDSFVEIDLAKDDAEITRLDLSGRGLIILPPNVKALDHVKHLDVSNNQLIYLPDDIGDCTALETLDLSHNALQGLPSLIGRLRALKQLTLSHNRISALPREIQDLTSLEVIDLRDNPLYFLSHRMLSLPNLAQCFVNSTHLSDNSRTVHIALIEKKVQTSPSSPE